MARSLDNELRQAIGVFVKQVASLAQRAAVETLETALAQTLSPTAASTLPHNSARAAGKRTPSELHALSDRFLGFVAENPGLRIEQINKRLGTTTKGLALPIRKLLASGEIKVKGRKRSTTYHAPKGVH